MDTELDDVGIPVTEEMLGSAAGRFKKFLKTIPDDHEPCVIFNKSGQVVGLAVTDRPDRSATVYDLSLQKVGRTGPKGTVNECYKLIIDNRTKGYIA